MRRARSSALVLLGSAFAWVGACSNSTAPLGNGDDLIVDVDADATTQPTQGDDGPYDDGFFARVEGGYPVPDGYSPYDWCTTCACPKDTYCFGGGTGVESFGGTCRNADAGPPPSSGTLAIGCYPLPPCGDEPSCECILAEVSMYLTCVPDCTDTTRIVSCPNP